jgi:hypothetical protein
MDEALRDWKFARSETTELLNVLSDEQLGLAPDGDKWQPVYYQFACMGRTQMLYAHAAKTGVMDFSVFGDPTLPSKFEQDTGDKLRVLLHKAEQQWQSAISQAPSAIKWPEHNLSLPAHLYRLISHERLHHGQLIGYFTLFNIDLPPRFKANWAL